MLTYLRYRTVGRADSTHIELYEHLFLVKLNMTPLLEKTGHTMPQ